MKHTGHTPGRERTCPVNVIGHAPVPGSVDVSGRADCPVCGKHVAVMARGRYAAHKCDEMTAALAEMAEHKRLMAVYIEALNERYPAIKAQNERESEAEAKRLRAALAEEK